MKYLILVLAFFCDFCTAEGVKLERKHIQGAGSLVITYGILESIVNSECSEHVDIELKMDEIIESMVNEFAPKYRAQLKQMFSSRERLAKANIGSISEIIDWDSPRRKGGRPESCSRLADFYVNESIKFTKQWDKLVINSN